MLQTLRLVSLTTNGDFLDCREFFSGADSLELELLSLSSLSLSELSKYSAPIISQDPEHVATTDPLV
jgi:hypothetical protein